MRSVRCDVCGSRALLAASQCPKCGHLFEIRDDSGELLPLAYCSSCDSYYPEQLGACRWCGTTPEHAPIAPQVWKGVGVAGFVALAFGAWLVREPPAIVSTDTMIPATTSARDDTLPARVPTTIVSDGSIADSSPPAPETPDDAPASIEVPRAAPRRAASSPPAPRATSKTRAPSTTRRRRTQWVRSVARHWVIVRADASGSARIVASIGPNTRVQLGERRGQWIRVRATGLAGWVDERAFFGGASGARSRRGVAAR